MDILWDCSSTRFLLVFQMKWTEVVQDCSQAVELNPRYIKALFRRAKALEKLDNRKECLEGETRSPFLQQISFYKCNLKFDFYCCILCWVFFFSLNCPDVTAVCILEAFQNQQSMLLADKVLKQLGKEKAKDKYKVYVHFCRDVFYHEFSLNYGINLFLNHSSVEPWADDAFSSVHQVLL